MVVRLLLLHKRRDGKDWETPVRGQVETEWGCMEVRLSVWGVLHTLLSRRVSLEWNKDCISQSIRCIWKLRDGVVLKKIGCHNVAVWAVVVSGDGKSIASGDQKGGITCTETQENLSPKPSKTFLCNPLGGLFSRWCSAGDWLVR